ncbi:MAG: TetR/AcrR family transcriptional regulator [Treponema sp.]|jgi:AcrR family transcriptional regulator|nr:TetR/AcrR family transcriptional regulator [Treponema sp.]
MENTKKTNQAPKKENRKTKHTRQAIRDSLIELMGTQPVTCITIKEICALAGISRPTFYAHYRDQYDLLKTIEDEISVYFENVIFADKAEEHTKREIRQKTEEALRYIENNSNSIQVLISENADAGFRKRFFRRFTEYVRHAAKNYLENNAVPEISELYSVFTVQGLIALVQHWLKNGMNPPKKELAAIITELIWTH